MGDKFFKTLGLCRRAGKLSYGYDAVIDSMGKCAAIYFAADLSARTRNSVLQQAARAGVPCTDIGARMAEIAYAIGTKPVGVIAVLDKGFAELLGRELQNDNRG